MTRPIVFFGTEEYSLIALRTLVEAGYEVAAVVTKPDTARGRGHKLVYPAVKTYAIEHDIPVWQPDRVRDIIYDIKSLDKPVGILVAYGRIIPQSVIELFEPGIVNVHPSLLPLYRGPSPVEAAILNRDRKTGVTIMQLDREMDAGPIYMQVPYALDFTETKLELYDTLFTLGSNLLVQKLTEIVDGTLKPTPQSHSDATYCPLLTKADGQLDLSTLTPGEAEAKIRAYAGFPRTRARVADYDIIVTRAHGVMTKKTPLDLECANGAFLSIDELIAPSGKQMTSVEFIRGYKLS